MKRLVIRFLLVLFVGATILYFSAFRSTREKPAETPNITTGPLGDMGTQVPGSSGRGVQTNPIRDVVIALHDKIDFTGKTGSYFQPIAQLRSRRVDAKSLELVKMDDAVLVCEIGEAHSDKSLIRRNVFEAIVGYEPPTADGVQKGRFVPSGKRPQEKKSRDITHIRIQASQAQIERAFPDAAPRVHFFGSPPDGVKITLFGGIEPVLEIRTDRLCCIPGGGGDISSIRVSSNSLVSLFSPDRLFEMAGIGLRGRLLNPKSSTEQARGFITLLREVRFEAARGPDVHRNDKKKRWMITENRTCITCDGPALLHLQKAPKTGNSVLVGIDMLELHDAVHIEDSIKAKNKKLGGFDSLKLDLFSNYLRARIHGQALTSVEAEGNVLIRSSHTPIKKGGRPHGSSCENVFTARGQRALLGFRDARPHRIRLCGWFVRYIRTGISLWGPSRIAAFFHQPPTVEGKFSGDTIDQGLIRARCDRDILLERLGGGPGTRRGRITLLENIIVDLEDLRRVKLKSGAGEPAFWIPGASTIKVRDRFVLNYDDQEDRLVDFVGTGRVRIDTLLGNLEAEEVTGVARNQDHWRIDAYGYPTLSHPIASRKSTPGLEKMLQSFTLTPPMSADRPSESAGFILIEGKRAVVELARAKQTDRVGKGLIRCDVHFTESVKVSQVEASSSPIHLYCQDLGFSVFQKPEGVNIDPASIRAEGNVILEGGKAFRATGDCLILDMKNRSSGVSLLTGLPARITIVDREGHKAFLEGKRLFFDSTEMQARAETGVYSRFYPSGAAFVLPVGSPIRIEVMAIEVEADSATVRWTKGRDVSFFQAEDTVRIRAFDRLGQETHAGGAPEERLLQWGEADTLCYELYETNEQVDPGKGAKTRNLRITLTGETDHPVRLGYRDPKHRAEDDLLLVVPVVVLESRSSTNTLSRFDGYGPGTVFFRSQEDLFGSNVRGGSGKEKNVLVKYPNGFTLRQVRNELYRMSFPDGGEITSRGRDGKLEAWITASKNLSLMLDNSARKEDDDFRVVERGYAEGDVQFKYKEDTRGGCDRAFWKRGTNSLTMIGSPAWGEKVGQGRQTFKKMVYDRATKRFKLFKGSGRLKKRFDRKEKP